MDPELFDEIEIFKIKRLRMAFFPSGPYGQYVKIKAASVYLGNA